MWGGGAQVADDGAGVVEPLRTRPSGMVSRAWDGYGHRRGHLERDPDDLAEPVARGDPPVVSKRVNKEEATPGLVVPCRGEKLGAVLARVVYFDAQEHLVDHHAHKDEVPGRTAVPYRVRDQLGHAQRDVVDAVTKLVDGERGPDEGARLADRLDRTVEPAFSLFVGAP